MSPVEFYLRFGEISASVHKSGAVRSDFVIRTPEMVNSVRGTIFSVRYDEKSRITTVTTEEGTVSSSPINSPEAAVMVTAGQSVQFDANGHVLSRSPINSPGKTVPSNSANAASGSGSTDRVPLKQYFSDARHEYYSTATKQGEQAAVGGGYKYVRIEGYVFRTQQPGTVPLKLYYSPARQDNFTTGTEQGEQAALGNGYKYVMDEGYLYPTERPGTVPLKLYYNPATHDNFTTATTEGDRDALANGYKFAWIEGYLFPAYRR